MTNKTINQGKLRNIKHEFGNFLKAVKTIIMEWHKNKLTPMSAALSFYSVLSLAPLTVIMLNILKLIIGDKKSIDLIANYFTNIFGAYSVKIVKAILLWEMPRGSIIISAIGFFVIIYGATRLLGMMQTTLNEIWEVGINYKKIHHIIRKELKSLFIIFITGAGFVSLLALETMMSAINNKLLVQKGLEWWLARQLIGFASQLIILTIIFAVLNKGLPSKKLMWLEVLPGSILSATLFFIGNKLMAWYLGKNMLASIYGAASSIVLLLLWAYYVSHIFLIGAAVNKEINNLHKKEP